MPSVLDDGWGLERFVPASGIDLSCKPVPKLEAIESIESAGV